jgi:geranylgeranyl reductase
VRKMKMISPSNREVDIGQTLAPNEWIGMCRREVMDGFLRDRAVEKGAIPINALVTAIDVPTSSTGKYVIHYSRNDGPKSSAKESLEVDVVIGADGANSRVAKAIDAGDYNYAIAFQERIKISEEKMEFYNEMAEASLNSSHTVCCSMPSRDKSSLFCSKMMPN